MTLVFGLDIGTTSIGFAVVELDSQQDRGSISWLGTRIFPEARNPDNQPFNQVCREKRLTRRQIRRRKQRRKLLNETLLKSGLLPPFSSSDPEFRSSEWATLMGRDPYDLRKRGLEEKLSLHEFGRAIYHLSKRRHFKGRDVGENAPGEDQDDAGTAKSKKPKKSEEAGPDSKKDAKTGSKDDEKKTKAAAEATHKTLKDQELTLGAWLSTLGDSERKRGKHALREDVEKEFERLWAHQATFHSVLNGPDLKDRISEIIFFQRPVFWRKSTLGTCPFWPDEELCPKGSWLSNQKRMLEKLNNLWITTGNGRPLEPGERAVLLENLQTQATMTWTGVRKALAPLYKAQGEAGAEKKLKFNLETGGEKGLQGNRVEAKLAGIFGEDWADHPHKQALRDALHERLWAADYEEIGTQRVAVLSRSKRLQRREAAAKTFIDDFKVTQEQAQRLSELTFPGGWEPYSIRALEQILPELEQGHRFGSLLNSPEREDWRNRTFPKRTRPTGEVYDLLPSPANREEQARLTRLRNPTVIRVQNELRKVVNTLIRTFGKPDRIRIEVTRDISRSAKERDKEEKRMRGREKHRKDAKADLIDNGIPEPVRRDMEKWLLWKETQERCPYTGETISFDALFRRGEFDVEHIWPRSRSLDDSMANKTLCHRDMNIRKGNRTPYEAFHGREEWDAITNRLEDMTQTKGPFPIGKKKRFLSETIPEDFASRQLNDTGFAAREAMAFLNRLWPDTGPTAPVRVEAVTGHMTDRLRRFWGLNNILSDDGEKNRNDHRHHAIDALVVACTSPGMTKRLSDYWRTKDDLAQQKPVFPKPWPSIRHDAERVAQGIIVSHRVTGRKISGPLHKETVYGDTGVDETTKSGVYRQIVTRKSVETLTISELEKIRDDAVRQIVAEWVAEHGGDPKKAFPPYPKRTENGPEIRKVRLIDKMQEKLMMRTPTGLVALGNNHHIALFQLPNGKADFEVVSLLDASRRLAARQPVVRRTHDSGGRFILSVCAGDAIEFMGGERNGIWIVTSIWDSGVIVLKKAADASRDKTQLYRPVITSLLPLVMEKKVRKVSIDPIGRLRPAND